ncbi:hypothetical protein PMZ80_005409 [Knufia obscura]|uniref:F5/8 type C domain-containing protein n=1 Tax=Knufia obscura TaxID=1635080 RepID=A0ABR0RRI0_9EURO|nr:hypothetical protein PMZ80_005409 [Knufia obscura]
MMFLPQRALILALGIGYSFAVLDAARITKERYGNDAPWFHDRIPLFESSDQNITDAYYYRWGLFRAHQRDLGKHGYVSTEFIDNVSWQTEPWATLNNAAGFHLNEGKWLRDRRFKNNYATFMYSDNADQYAFSERMADAVWSGYLVDGDIDFATGLLDQMKTTYEGWANRSNAAYTPDVGMYWIEPLPDATEYTISSIDASGGYDGFTGGYAFRPTINSYQYANARAISKLAEAVDDLDTAANYTSLATDLKERSHEYLWNATLEHFIDRHADANNTNVTYFAPIRGRELAGYVPWTHDLADDNATLAQAWKHMLDPDELRSPFGLRTVEPSYEYYMRQYRYEGEQPECQWNGPIWPFQTSQVLTGMANLLDHYPKSQGVVGVSDYTNLLRLFAQLHYNRERGGILCIEEDYYPGTGYPLVGLARSPHYFHSGFNDLVLRDFVGIKPQANDSLVVNPHADPQQILYFRADRIIYHGHEIAVQWDATGKQYGSAGLQVEVDGKVVAKADTLTRLTVNITRQPAPSYKSPIAKSIQLNSTMDYPHGNVSIPNADIDRVHDVLDGRIWWYPEIINGFDTPVNTAEEVWYQIDFGNKTEVSRAEIAFFADERLGYDVPTEYKVQTNQTGSWEDVAGATYTDAVPNGITEVSWESITVRFLRLLFTPKPVGSVRLVEFKVF